MQGMVELGEEIFHMPVRVGTPDYAGGLAEVVRNPRYSTGVGLLCPAWRTTTTAAAGALQGGSFKQVFERMKSWFQGNF